LAELAREPELAQVQELVREQALVKALEQALEAVMVQAQEKEQAQVLARELEPAVVLQLGQGWLWSSYHPYHPMGSRSLCPDHVGWALR